MPATTTRKVDRPSGKTRVFLIAPVPVFADALRVAISIEDDLVWVGSASSSSDAVDTLDGAKADVILIDMDAPSHETDDLDGADATKYVKTARPEVRVLILSSRMDVDALARVAEAGACGFLSKESTVSDICHAIRTAKDGGMFVERELIEPLIGRLSRGRQIGGGSAKVDVTPREQDVLTLLGEGLDVANIARRLNISLNTCRGHVKNLLTKLGSHSQLEAVVEAVHQGLLPHLSR